MADLENGQMSAATQRLETVATRLLNLGETDLARSALLEAGWPGLVIFPRNAERKFVIEPVACQF